MCRQLSAVDDTLVVNVDNGSVWRRRYIANCLLSPIEPVYGCFVDDGCIHAHGINASVLFKDNFEDLSCIIIIGDV